MFYNGKIYKVKKITLALQEVIAAKCNLIVKDISDPLEAYDVVSDALNGVEIVGFLVRHLIPDYDGKITEDNKKLFAKYIKAANSDPIVEAAMTQRDARRYHELDGKFN